MKGRDAPLWRTLIAVMSMLASSVPPSLGIAAEPSSAQAEEDYAQAISNAWDRDSLGAFLPRRTGDFILPWETLQSQVGEALGSAPLYARGLPDRRRLLWGCRRHSCPEKAAVLVSAAGKVEAAALIHYGCHFTGFPVRRSSAWRKSNYTCEEQRKLTLFLHVTQTHRPALEAWSEVVTGERLPVEVYWV